MRERKIAIFVDGSNFSAALRAVGFRVDYDKVLAEYNTIGSVVNASYFTALPPPEVYSSIRALVDRLAYHGWTAVTKEMKTNITHDGYLRDKGNMDVEIAVRAMELAPHITDLVLFSGDGDFRILAEALQKLTVRVTAVSYFSKNDTCIVADELRRQVNEFINIADKKETWQSDKPPRSPDDIERRRKKFVDGH